MIIKSRRKELLEM